MVATRCKFGLILVVLAVLPDCPRAADHGRAQGGIHSLQCVFNMTFNEQQRCVVHVLKDRMLILSYDCSNMTVMFETQEINDTNILEDMKQTLKEVWDKMRRRRLDRVYRTLQVRLECQSNASGSSCGPWEFRVDGQRCLAFDSGSREYKVADSRGDALKEELENDENLKEFLKKTSEGDCKRWLKVLVHRKKGQETAAAPATATPPAVSATPATTPAAARSQDVTTVIVVAIILGIIACVIIVVYICYRKRRCCFRAPESVV